MGILDCNSQCIVMSASELKIDIAIVTVNNMKFHLRDKRFVSNLHSVCGSNIWWRMTLMQKHYSLCWIMHMLSDCTTAVHHYASVVRAFLHQSHFSVCLCLLLSVCTISNSAVCEVITELHNYSAIVADGPACFDSWNISCSHIATVKSFSLLRPDILKKKL